MTPVPDVSVLQKNIAANLAGGVWTGLMGLVFVPVYIHFIGIEAYGLMGIFATLLAIFFLLDMGLSGTLNREMARLAVQEGSAREMRDLLRTLEIPYWLAGLLISAIVIAASPFIAYRWVNAEHLSPGTVQTAIRIMGLAAAFQWPIGLYSGGLMGLQRQVPLNVIAIVMATVRGLGAVLILWLVSPTVEAFFYWQLAVSVVHVGVAAFFLWRSLPHAPEPPCFRRALLVNVWRFAAGMTGITVTVTILMQLDKVILSRMLSLEMFGYYALANVVTLVLYRLGGPVFTATYPRLTSLVALGATEDIKRLYHQSTQLVAVLILPAALVLAMFSEEVLLLWTRSPVTAERAHVLVSILVAGTAVNGVLQIPYALQLAHGWTRIAILGNIVSVVLLVPLMIVLTTWYGAAGAASIWVALNVGYLLISVPVMHLRLLPGEQWRWYAQDVGRPLLAGLGVAVVGRLFIKADWPPMLMVTSLAVVGAGTLAAAACAASQLRVIARGRSIVTALVLRHSHSGNPR